MLEEKIDALTAALKENTATVKKHIEALGGSAGSGSGETAEASGGKKDKKSKFTADQVKAAVVKVKEEKGQDAAKAIISDAGAKNLAELVTLPKKFDSVMAACEAALAATDDDNEDEDDDEL